MDRKSKILIIIFFSIFAAAIAAIFYRYVVLEDISYETDEQAFQATLLEK